MCHLDVSNNRTLTSYDSNIISSSNEMWLTLLELNCVDIDLRYIDFLGIKYK
jgi:hypothetical protein